MNKRSGHFLTSLIFIVFVCASTHVGYSQQQTVENSPGSISGHLTNAQKPLSNIEVQLLVSRQPAMDQQRLVATVLTDATGYYRFTGVAPMTYVVSPNTKNFVPSDVKNYAPGKSVKVTSGLDVTNIDFNLSTAAKIQGQIRDVSGSPVVGRKVLLTVVAGNQNQAHPTAHSFVSKPSDDQGNYITENVSPGRYVVSIGGPLDYAWMLVPSRAKGPIYAQTFHPGAAKLADASAVEVTEGANITGIDITVEAPIKPYLITGRVIDEQTGAGIPNVAWTIVFTGADGIVTEMTSLDWITDSDGRFRMPLILPGHVIVKVTSNKATHSFGDPVDLGLMDKDVTGLEIKMHRPSTPGGV